MDSSHPSSGERGLFGLAPGGVYQAIPVARDTGELLPHLFTLIPRFAGRYLFCGTFLTPTSCIPGSRSCPYYGPPCPVELGLSSPHDPVTGMSVRSDPLFPFAAPFLFFLFDSPLDRLIGQTIRFLVLFPRNRFNLEGRKASQILSHCFMEGL
jgi:hypothetical protein